MNQKINILIVFLFCQFIFVQIVQSNTIQYTSPVSGSVYNMESTNIIIGFSEKINSGYIRNLPISLTGSLSGNHSYKLEIVEKGTRIIISPDSRFAFGEKVTVSGLKGHDDLSFYIRNSKPNVTFDANSDLEFTNKEKVYPFHRDFLVAPDSLPVFTIYNSGSTASGYLFLSNFSGVNINSYLMILQNSGVPVKAIALNLKGYDFKKQNDNLLTYYEEMIHCFLGLNSSYEVVDTFYTGNGYTTDIHELRVQPDGSAWLLSYDAETVDMSVIVSGGKPNAIVTGLIIQKIDVNKHVVFQWRSWDHFQITDATHENLTAYNIDYVHGNAIEVESDGNILLSSRHLDEITKINSVTGEIIWRLGGKNNEFNFLNDSIGFSHQHHIRRLENAHIMLFDNGNYHTPAFSRVVEYSIDEGAKTLFLEWQYRHTPEIFSSAMGSAQRLSNGNTLIGWGAAATTLTEVTPQGNIAYELSLPATEMSYRAYRDEWGSVTLGQPDEQGAPEAYCLYQNNPNPFNPTTNINYRLAKNSYVTLKVYNVLGKEITTLVNGFQNAGEHKVQFPGSQNVIGQLQSGIYFYKLQTESFTDVKKMVLVK